MQAHRLIGTCWECERAVCLVLTVIGTDATGSLYTTALILQHNEQPELEGRIVIQNDVDKHWRRLA